MIHGIGHVFMMERGDWFDELMAGRFEMGERLDGRL